MVNGWDDVEEEGITKRQRSGRERGCSRSIELQLGCTMCTLRVEELLYHFKKCVLRL
jgi:hypothetical protein